MDLSLLGMLSAAGGGSSSSKKADDNPVVLDGLQGGVPFNEISVSGKNLIPYPYASGDTWISHGVTFTVNSDGTITADGTINEDGYLTYTLYSGNNLYLSSGTYTLSGLPNPDTITTAGRIVIKFWNETNSIIYNQKGGKFTFTLSEIKAIDNIYIRWYTEGTVFDNVVFKPQLELGDTATAYEPPITGRELQVNVCGKNLLKYPYASTTKTMNGITFTDNGDGTIIVNGTSTAQAHMHLAFARTDLIHGVKYTLSGCPKGDTGNSYFLYIAEQFIDGTSNGVYHNDVGDGVSFILKDNCERVNITIFVRSGITVDNIVFRPQLELGDTATDYEPYHGTEYTITPDSNPYTVPVDITQYDGINVLSISDDSNPIISVSGNKASEQLGTIYRTLNNKPVLLFDGTIPTSSMDGYAEFTVDKEYSAFMIVPICNDSNVYEPGACTVIPIGYATEEEQGFTVYGYPRSLQRVTRAFIKRVGDAFYVRSSSTACGYMTIYGI